MPKIIGVIPARLHSTRLPRKVLRPIGTKAMVQWVYEGARKSPLLDELYVATDSDEVRSYCAGRGIPVLATGEHPSGSDRLYEVLESTDGDIYVNIQGDEPTIRAEHMELLIRPIVEGRSRVTTLRVAIDEASAQDPNCVKVVTGIGDRALYFSRHPVPFHRDPGGMVRYYKHIGVYGYTREALIAFHGLPQAELELAEKLEQLRFLEHGISVLAVETIHDTIGVDTEADLERAAAALAAFARPG